MSDNTADEPLVEHKRTNGIGAEIDLVDLIRRDTERVPQAYKLDELSSIVITKLRQDERVETHDLERYLDAPRRPRGHASVYDPSDFAELINRLAEPGHTTIWADVHAGTMTGVINDHGDWVATGWRDHTVTLTLQADEDWTRWHDRDGKRLDQATFAEFVEDVSHTIVRPDAATMLEVATTMSASRNVQFKQGTRLDTGDVQLTCIEITNAQAGATGNIEIPEKITVRIAPWLGVEPIDLTARLRWRIPQGQLSIGYQLLRSDIARRDAFAHLVAGIRDDVDEGIPLFLGPAPKPLN